MLTLGSKGLIVAAVIGNWELIVITAVVLMLLGAKRIPDVIKGLGDGFSRFRKDLDSEARDAGESLGGIYGKPAAEALTPDNHTAEIYDPAAFQDRNANWRAKVKDWFRRWIGFCRAVCKLLFERLSGKR